VRVLAAPKKSEAMRPKVERYELKGLCMTCNHAGFCLHLARSAGRTWSCEDFDDGPPAAPLRARRADATPPNPPAAAEENTEATPAEPAPGLCANCMNLSTCNLPKGEGGIWHCEEYL